MHELGIQGDQSPMADPWAILAMQERQLIHVYRCMREGSSDCVRERSRTRGRAVAAAGSASR